MKPVHKLLPAFFSLPCALATMISPVAALAQTPVEAPAPPPAPAPPASLPPGDEPGAVAPAPPPAPADPPPAVPPPPPPRGSDPPPPSAGKVNIAAPPVPPPRERRGYHSHDGFYLRMGAGVGGTSISLSTDSRSVPDYDIGGGSLALNLWLGGSPSPGLAIGGMLSTNGLSDDEVTIDDRDYAGGVDGGLSSLAFFLDVFPDPQRGLHFGGALGLAAISLDPKDEEFLGADLSKYEGGGLGFSTWIGYMGWVGPEWSLGGMLQLSGAWTRQEEDDLTRDASGYALSISFSALYH